MAVLIVKAADARFIQAPENPCPLEQWLRPPRSQLWLRERNGEPEGWELKEKQMIKAWALGSFACPLRGFLGGGGCLSAEKVTWQQDARLRPVSARVNRVWTKRQLPRRSRWWYFSWNESPVAAGRRAREGGEKNGGEKRAGSFLWINVIKIAAIILLPRSPSMYCVLLLPITFASYSESRKYKLSLITVSLI